MDATVMDVMSTHVIAVRQDAPYKVMAAMLHKQRVSAFPVIDDDNNNNNNNKVIGAGPLAADLAAADASRARRSPAAVVEQVRLTLIAALQDRYPR